VNSEADGETGMSSKGARFLLKPLVRRYFFISIRHGFAFGHSQNGAAEAGVLAPGEFAVEAGAHFQEAAHAAVNLCPTAKELARQGNEVRASVPGFGKEFALMKQLKSAGCDVMFRTNFPPFVIWVGPASVAVSA
jgi:hypothetical protein